ncbi:sensor domain-containing diguanylate cyclase [Aureimonas frigidaquae]|uniref:Diguanylate cyclase GGDEF domain-containing protein n=1 Tax=Aureimonas frigidaquae TaxID=424757 RepID=A0A0P0Z3H2_9HYPH|nr:sensor domain-containing diguanylate cyclase [Aureimonas frigidaquae]BAT28644.1 diguanylate cyclase GGDEF domain-containing protein precursor [Aureimonas frigidaquae]
MQSVTSSLALDGPESYGAIAPDSWLDRTVLDAAFSAARMGVWECSLPDETLRWTAGVYDLFDLPRWTIPDRAYTLSLYSPASRAELTALRAHAIAEGTGFEMDAEIVTPLNNRRWIRITATVECSGGMPVRIFGIKRDITRERSLFDRVRYLSEHDPLTGLANRAVFQSALAEAAHRQDDIALILVDLDGFKLVNDQNGHAAGDAVLRHVGRIIAEACLAPDVAARIGGDEFALVVRAGAQSPVGTAEQIIAALQGPVQPGLSVGASVGIALLRDHGDMEAVFHAADTALYAAKAAGRGRWRLAPRPAS